MLFNKQQADNLQTYFEAIYADEKVEVVPDYIRAAFNVPEAKARERFKPDSNFSTQCDALYNLLAEKYDLHAVSYVTSRAQRWHFIDGFIRLMLRDISEDLKKDGIKTTDDFMLSNWLRINPPKDFVKECEQVAARMNWNMDHAIKTYDSFTFDDQDPESDEYDPYGGQSLSNQEKIDYSNFMLCDAPFIAGTLELFQAALSAQGGKDTTVMVLSSFTDGLRDLIKCETDLHPDMKARFIAAIEKSLKPMAEEEHISIPDLQQIFRDVESNADLADGYEMPSTTLVIDNRPWIEAKKMWDDIDPDVKRDLQSGEIIIPENAYNPL